MMPRNQQFNNIMMISLHGYVAAEPELGKPDTGGQVVYVLELAKRFSRLGWRVDLITRRFEDQPEFDEINDNLRVWRIPLWRLRIHPQRRYARSCGRFCHQSAGCYSYAQLPI